MLDEAFREVILQLNARGHSHRQIARALGVSRTAVRRVLEKGTAELTSVSRAFKAGPYRQEIEKLYVQCRGNLVRVHEELLNVGAPLSYSALTRFCRRYGIGRPSVPAVVGHYVFEPGVEMQHDTSPHVASVGGRPLRLQTASLVCCFSRMLFFQHYPTFNRFYCKLFLTEALKYFEGACATCMIDNTHVVVLRGTGADMLPVPEMEAFAQRFDFVFRAHEPGDANRSARVERPMHYIENNFLAGRDFRNFDELNQQAVMFCDRANASFKKHLRSSPRELFATERSHLKPLPIYIPEVYQLHHRIVDTEGYVCIHTYRYSVPYRLIGKRLEVRETKDRLEFFDGPRRVAIHRKLLEGPPRRVTLPEHRPPRGQGPSAQKLSVEEQELLGWGEPMPGYLAELKKRSRRGVALRQLLRLSRDYPREAFLRTLQTAAHYGLYDLERLERMLLRSLATEYFVVDLSEDPPDDE